MNAYPSIHQTATAALAATIRAEQKRAANACACGAPGLILADDETTPICGRCELDARKEEAKG